MKQLDISITKAQLEGFTLVLGETPTISATIGLYTNGGKKITTYTANTNAWDDSKKLKVAPKAHMYLAQASKLIEAAIVQHCVDSQGALGTGSDLPLDLSDIPF
jgi:hypothetical protein